MAKLSELLVATLATAALVACGDSGGGGDSSGKADGGGAGGTTPTADAGTGGSATGGSATGGSATGGSTGGAATGGSTGGAATGGSTGGAATGGSTGGAAAGGTTPPPAGCEAGDAVCEPNPPSSALCDAPPCTWPEAGEWAPAARVNWINVPANADCAAAVGCQLHGALNGTALSSLLPLLNSDAPPPPPGEACPDSGLAAYVQPDEAGDIQLKLLSRLLGINAGAFAAASGLDLQLYTGDATANPAEWTIDPVSFVEGTQDPLIHFSGASLADNGLLHTSASRFSLSLPIMGLPISLALEGAQVTGYVGVGTGNTGYKLADGLIGGYLTRESIVALLSGLDAACSSPAAPSFCPTLRGLLPAGSCTPENCDAGINLISGLLGGFEAAVGADGMASDCNPQDPTSCNAIGVCLQVEMEGVTITGITQ